MSGFTCGDVIWGYWPHEDGIGGKKRYILVISSDDETGQGQIFVAYGSSQKVCASAPVRGELVIHEVCDLARAGLHCPTRFDLLKTRWISPKGFAFRGDVRGGEAKKRFFQAAKLADLI